jgi:hypothetical protein
MHALQEKELVVPPLPTADSITVFNPATGERLYDLHRPRVPSAAP